VILFTKSLLTNRFHLFNCTKHSDYIPEIGINDFDLYARTPPDSRAPKGWLVDLLNKYVTSGKLIIIICKL